MIKLIVNLDQNKRNSWSSSVFFIPVQWYSSFQILRYCWLLLLGPPKKKKNELEESETNIWNKMNVQQYLWEYRETRHNVQHNYNFSCLTLLPPWGIFFCNSPALKQRSRALGRSPPWRINQNNVKRRGKSRRRGESNDGVVKEYNTMLKKAEWSYDEE